MTDSFDFSESSLEKFHTSYQRSDGCWLWQRAKLWWGHGSFYDAGHGRVVGAHRFMYALVNGPIPDGMVVMHKCDVPGCVRPDHLSLGTASENSIDCALKGRKAKGQRNGRAKLTDAQAEEIRRVYVARHPEFGGYALGRKYGVSGRMIGLVVSGTNWRTRNGQGAGC